MMGRPELNNAHSRIKTDLVMSCTGKIGREKNKRWWDLGLGQ